MRRVKFISGLNVEEVMTISPAEHRYYAAGPVSLARISEAEAIDVRCETRAVPVMEFFHRGKPGIYIAVSHEVEELLGIPINTIYQEVGVLRKQCERAEKANQSYVNAFNRFCRTPVWKRLMLAWKGRIE